MNYSKMSKRKQVLLKRLLLTISVSVAVGVAIGNVSAKMVQGVMISENAKTYGVSDGKHSSELTWYGKGSDGFVALDVDMDEKLQKYVFDECRVYGIDFCFIMAVIDHESQFQSDIISSTNDYGLMQINEINHEWLSKELGITDFLNAKDNIHAGVYVFRQLFEKYEDPELVLMAYNFGEGGAKELWDEGIYSSEYAREILDKQVEYQEEYERKVSEND